MMPKLVVVTTAEGLALHAESGHKALPKAALINLDFPSGGITDYLQHIGSDGCLEAGGKVMTFFSPLGDGYLSRKLADILQESGQQIPDGMVRDLVVIPGPQGNARAAGASGGRGPASPLSAA